MSLFKPISAISRRINYHSSQFLLQTNVYINHFCSSSEIRISDRIRQKLELEFCTEDVHITDTSGGCGTFFSIEIISEKFNGLKTFQRHKMVNKVLKEDIEQLHGLTLKTSTIDENK